MWYMLCTSVHLSINGWMNQVCFHRRQLSLSYIVLELNSGIFKIRVLPSRTSSKTLDFENLATTCWPILSAKDKRSRRRVVDNARQWWTWPSAINIDQWPSLVDHSRRPVLCTVGWVWGSIIRVRLRQLRLAVLAGVSVGWQEQHLVTGYSKKLPFRNMAHTGVRKHYK